MFVDKQYFLPISLKIIDDKGLFEEYNYHNLIVNPNFQEGEFTKEYKDYKF
jgi:outer membrane lipoprotein-sorting protein